MTWHVVVRVGQSDGFSPAIAAQEPRIEASFERTDDPWHIGNDVIDLLQKVLVARPPEVAIDLVYLAMAIYAADLRIPRKFAGDRWERDITVYLPVGNLSTWTAAMPQLLNTLNFLTGDRWRILVRARGSAYPGTARSTNVNVDSLCLFSGGLDSLAGAINVLAAKQRVALIGHHGAGMTKSVQDRLLQVLKHRYTDCVTPLLFYAQPPKRNLKDGEPSMRSRSFLFLALGVATATSFGKPLPLIIAENGLISLNVPLTPARTGSSSTRTTHPHFIELYRGLLSKLRLDVPLQLPYRFLTKGEMLMEATDRDTLIETAKLSMSCSHSEAGRYQGFTPGNHCGYCVPCIIRRASMEHADLQDASYNVDVRTNPPDFRQEAGRDFRAFEMAVERFSCTSIRDSLASVLATGPIPADDAKAYANVYRRGMEEVSRFLRKTT